uniref:Uncharacterized protein n=1 Tax=Helianthus annuus TaxID=4232 RepID=A0A251TIC0_HELAN
MSPLLLQHQNHNNTPKPCCKTTCYVHIKPYLVWLISCFIFSFGYCGWVFMN